MTTVHTPPKRRRMLLFGALLLLALTVFVAVFPRTEWAHSLVRDLVSDAVHGAFGGTLAIGKIEGNLWGSITVEEVTLRGATDTIASLRRLEVDYDLLPLLRREILLRRVLVDSLHVRLHQSEEGVWNLAEIITPGDSTTADSPPSPWSVAAPSVTIQALSASITPRTPAREIPEELERLDLEGSFLYAPAAWNVSITHCSLTTARPTLHLRRLVLRAAGDTQRIRVDSLGLQTDSLSITSTATVSLPPGLASSGSIHTSTPSFAEIRRFLPGFPLKALPPAILTANYSDDVLRIQGTIDSSALTFEGTLATAGRHTVANLHTRFAEIDPSQWLTAPLPRMDLTGSLRGEASLDDPLGQDLHFRLALAQSRIAPQTITQATVEGTARAGDLDATIALAAPGAVLAGTVTILDLTGRQELTAAIDFSDLDLSTAAGLRELPGTLNGSFKFNGRSLDIDRLRGRMLLEVHPSEVASFPLDSLLLRCSIASPEFIIDTLTLHSKPLEMGASGWITRQGDADIMFDAHLKDPTSLTAFAGLDTIRGLGNLRGTLRTAGDSLALDGSWNLTALEGFGLTVDSLAGTGALRAGAAGADLRADIAALDVHTGSLRADSLNAAVHYSKNRLWLESSLGLPGNNSIRLNALAMRDSLVHLLVPRLEVTIENDTWTNGPDTIRCSLQEGTTSIAGATLSSGTRSLVASGVLSSTGMNDFIFRLDHLPLSYAEAFFESPPPLAGDISLAVRLEGLLPEPVVSCSVIVEDAKLGDQTLGYFRTIAAYRGDSTLTWQITATGRYGNLMSLEGSFPLRHTPAWDSIEVDPDRPLQGRLLMHDYQLSRLRPAFPKLEGLRGTVTSDLSLGGTLRSPEFSGSFRIDSGAVSSSALGLAYDSIAVEIIGADTLLVLRHFTIQSNRGLLRANGVLASVSDLFDMTLRPRQLEVEMQEFLAIQSHSLEARLSGPMNLQAEQDTVRVSGDLTVSRARVWVPAFFRADRGTGDEGIPRLVAALQERDSTAFRDSLSKPELAMTILQSVAGRIQARIPNNTWLQSQELNVEISGNLEFAIRGPDVTISGFVKVERGTFMVLGKKFVVREGRADFAGGSDPIPQIWMEVAYVFRRPDGIEQSLDLQMTGRATKPSLGFRLNGEPVSEQDAVSYVLFGRSLDELSQSQKSSVSQSTGDLAAGLAASFLTAQLSSTVGEAFGLDVLELNVQDAGRQSSFTAGKYISDRLYVRYTRRVNDPSTNETNTDEVALEYRLLPFLYIQMIQGTSKATGYDLLFRFD